jgi:hypothetical protein
MHTSEVPRAVSAGMSAASALGLRVDDAFVLHNSNRLAVRLLPCNVLARVAPWSVRQTANSKSKARSGLAKPMARCRARTESGARRLRAGYAFTLWTYYEPGSSRPVAPAEYAPTLERLHAGVRQVDLAVPHTMDRVANAQWALSNRDRTPEVVDADRQLLSEPCIR